MYIGENFSTNESEGKPEHNFDAAFGTIRNSEFFSQERGRLKI
jgi:hypothetical protein